MRYLRLTRTALGGGGGTASYHDGIGLDFTKGLYYLKPTGGVVSQGSLTSLFTFTGGNQSMYMGGGGLLVQSATNTPRIEYHPSGSGACLGLLMEAARTNIWTQSQDFTTTWTTTSTSVTANQTAAPDGTTTADLIKEDGTTNLHGIINNATLVASTSYAVSVFAKAKERTWVQLNVQTPDGTFRDCYFNLAAGTVGTATSCTGTITSYPNGWYRCCITFTGGAGVGSPLTRIYLATANGTNSYAGDGTSGLYLWGAQIEAGLFPSSYIPTTTASVARTADSCIRTLGTEFSATAGTVVIAGRAGGGQDAAAQSAYAFDDGTTTHRMVLVRPGSSDTARVNFVAASVAQATFDFTFSSLTAYKMATAWAANDFSASFNGSAVSTDAAGTIPTVTQLGIGNDVGSSQFNGHIRTFDYYPTRLPNTFLVSAST